MLSVDLDVGKPADVGRAVDRRLGAVDVGDRDAWCDCAARAPCRGDCGRRSSSDSERRARCAEADDHGSVELVLPRLFALGVGKADAAGRAAGTASEICVGVNVAGRSPAQIATDAARELAEAALPSGAVVHLSAGPEEPALVTALVAAGAARVLVDGVIVHPPLFSVETHATDLVVLRARLPARANDADLLRQVERELPRALDQDERSDVDRERHARIGRATPIRRAARADDRADDRARSEVVALGCRRRQTGAAIHPVVNREFVRVLGRKEDSTVPMTCSASTRAKAKPTRPRSSQRCTRWTQPWCAAAASS